MRDINYIDPCLEDILKETYGIIVYQEQIMRIFQRIAGYSLGFADVLRRILNKNTGDIEWEKIKYLKDAVKQGFSEEKAGEVFDMLFSSAGYAYNKSHAAAYTKIAYQTGYLKANFPAEFMAANNRN